MLWYYYNAKDEIPGVDVATQAIFDQGHLVGEYAKRLFPNGIEVGGGPKEFMQTIEQTQEAVKLRKPLFEAAFMYKQAYARADILNPIGRNQWEIIEVKSSTQVKEVNLHDLALQMYTYSGAGLNIARCCMMYVNNEYVRDGDIVPGKLFIKEDVSDKVEKLLPEIEKNLARMAETIKQMKSPDIPIGLWCNDPYGCPLIDVCWAYLPEANPTTLYYFKKEKAFELIHSGIHDIRDLPDDIKLSDKQAQQVECHKTGKPYIDVDGINAFLSGLVYPLYFLDFETIGTAIPLFDNVKPYQNIPFQYSMHILDKPSAKLKHLSFLSNGKKDPRPLILQQLKEYLGSEGSIVAYNASFEKGVMRNAVEIFSEYKEWYAAIEARVVDLLTPFKSFYYYHPKQNGSASIKVVLPALTRISYDNMEIAEGGTASNEFLRVTFGDVPDAEREKVRNNLLEYCKLDTMGMVEIVRALERIVNV